MNRLHAFLMNTPPLPPSGLKFDALKAYVLEGGSLLFMMGEGGETRFDTNVNFFFEEFGVMINNGENGANKT